MHSVVSHSAACTVAADYASGLSSGTKKLGVGKRRERKGADVFQYYHLAGVFSVGADGEWRCSARSCITGRALDEQGTPG